MLQLLGHLSGILMIKTSFIPSWMSMYYNVLHWIHVSIVSCVSLPGKQVKTFLLCLTTRWPERTWEVIAHDNSLPLESRWCCKMAVSKLASCTVSVSVSSWLSSTWLLSEGHVAVLWWIPRSPFPSLTRDLKVIWRLFRHPRQRYFKRLIV